MQAALDAGVLSKHSVPGSISVYCLEWVNRRSSRGVSWCKTAKKGVVNMSQLCAVLVMRQTLQERMRKSKTNQDIFHFANKQAV